MEKIRLWWKFEGRYYISNFKKGLKNLWYWFPIIWKDRDYHHAFIFSVLQHKLKSQANYIGRRNFHTRAQTDARNMRICVNLIQKLQDDFYECEYIDYYKSSSEFVPCTKEDFFEYQTKEISENFDEYFKKYPLIYSRVKNGEGVFDGDSKKVIAMNISTINHQRAMKLLFKILEEEIQCWWD